KEHPALGGIERPELKRRFETAVEENAAAYFDDLLVAFQQRRIVHAESNLISLPGLERKLEGALADSARKIEDALKAGALAPPTIPEIQASLKIQPKTLKEIMKFLLDTGVVV